MGPLARPKTPASPPPPVPATASTPSSKPAAATRDPSHGAPGKADQLTFYQALKEDSPRAEKGFVPFKPTGEAPPALEALVPKKAPQQEVPPPPPSPPARPPKALEPHERYYVEVSAFQFKENARRLAWKLQQEGYNATMITTTGRQRNQVRVGPYTSEEEAAVVARRLRRALLYPATVIRQTAPRGG